MKSPDIKSKLNTYTQQEVTIILKSGNSIHTWLAEQLGAEDTFLSFSQMSGLTSSVIHLTEIADVRPGRKL